MTKHGNVESFCINSTNAVHVSKKKTHTQQIYTGSFEQTKNSLIIRSQCFLAASNPSLNNLLNSRNGAPVVPPNTSIYSGGNLKGAASNPILPGVLLRMNPKSI